MKQYIQLIENSMLVEGEILPSIEKLAAPLTDDMVIRMFHGVNDPSEVYKVLTQGLSGKSKANRNYSYEANNNPYGLFVTPDFETAKKFGAYILELNIRLRDLEAPVWPNGNFVAQGQYAPSFNDNDERDAAVIKAREAAMSMDDLIANSTRPELAASLLAHNERQALFTGELDPNSTKAVWKRDDPTSTVSSYQRMTRREFIEIFNNGEAKNPFSGQESSPDMIKSEGVSKVLRPRERASLDVFVQRLVMKNPKFLTYDKVIGILSKNQAMIRDYVWTDEQYNALIEQLNALS